MEGVKYAVGAVLSASLLWFGVSVNSFAANYVAGANYSNGQVYALCFDDDTLTAERSTISVDGGTKPVSLVFYTGDADELGKESLQLLVADEAGEIRRFSWGEELIQGEEPQKNCNDIVITALAPVYAKSTSDGPQSPNGLALAKEEQLIVLDSANGNSASDIWRIDLKSGATPVLIANNLPYGNLEESLVLPSNVTQIDLHNDLLVVASQPSVIFKLDSDCLAPGTALCDPANMVEFIGGSSGVALPEEPVGMAILPSPLQNKLLVSTSAGTVMVYDISGPQPVLVDSALVADLGAGKFKLKTSRKVVTETIDSQKVITFAADLYIAGRNNGSVVKVGIEEVDDTLQLSAAGALSVNQGIEHPRGLATTSDDFIRILACDPLTEDCPDTLKLDISTVVEHEFNFSQGEQLAGYVGETFQILKDPRPECVGPTASTDPGKLWIYKDNLYTTNPDPIESVEIPGYMCGSPASDPHIMVVKTLSNILPTKIQLDHKAYYTDFDDDGIADLDCYASDRSIQPVFGWAPIPNTEEDHIVEGNQIIDLTSGCGSVRIRTRDLSYFVIGLRHQIIASGGKGKNAGASATDQYGEVIWDELANLTATLVEADTTPADDGDTTLACVAETTATLETVYSQIADLQVDIEKGRLRRIEDKALVLLTTIRANALGIGSKLLDPLDETDFGSCKENYLADVQSRMEHIYFSIATKLLEKTWTPDCPATDTESASDPLLYCLE